MGKSESYENFREQFESKGYAKIHFDDEGFLSALKNLFLQKAETFSKSKVDKIENIHKFIDSHLINDFRVSSIQAMNSDTIYREMILSKFENLLIKIFGPDLAVQRNMNLVISPPGDRTSQIPLHADTWTGHSAFELVLLVPLVEVRKKQNMFILPQKKWALERKHLDPKKDTLQTLTKKWKDSFDSIELNTNEIMLFWHELPHGNIPNQDASTHWSINLRIKNLFTPYGDKALGNYFIPWRTSSLTKVIMALNENVQ